jgi:hypothetical protein
MADRWFSLPYFHVCPKSGPGFPLTIAVVFFVCKGLSFVLLILVKDLLTITALNSFFLEFYQVG